MDSYEKKYKEALEKARQLCAYPTSKPFISDLQDLFPELKKSEGDSIRKELIGFLRNNPNGNYTCEEMAAWLEKQSEHLENYDEAEKEKADFVGDGFIECYTDFLDFKEGNTYWLEYIGDDKYNVRSDNLLGKTYHITPCQLYTVFKKMTWLEKQGNKTAWSDEDEVMLQACLDTLQAKSLMGKVDTTITMWLKSLKVRIGG